VAIAIVQVLGLSVWFSATAVAPSLQGEWGIDSVEAVWLTATVQIGFVVGAVASALLTIADRFPPQRLLAVSALGAATCTAAMSIMADGLSVALLLRFMTGVFLAGVYPVGMKLTASWSDPLRRGRAFGLMLGALTVGSALPHLVSGFGQLPWRYVLLVAAALAVVGACVATVYVREGPFSAGRFDRPNPRYVWEMYRSRVPRLANLGYFGHMWELYAFWTWLPAFVIAGNQYRADGDPLASPSLLVFGAIGIAGCGGCFLGGWASDRFGRSKSAAVALGVSGACCLLSPLIFNASSAVLAVFVLVWGAAVIADSGVFSVLLSEAADSRFVGTALTAQTAVGFLLTVVTIQLLPLIAAAVGWQYAFVVLALGPVAGVAAMLAVNRP
jgi:MFS family permease